MKKLLVLTLLLWVSSAANAQNIRIKSPDGSLECNIGVNSSGNLVYSVEFQKRQIILPSPEPGIIGAVWIKPGKSIWAWVHARDVRTNSQRDEYFNNAKSVGLVDLKVDFMGAVEPEWVQRYDDIMREGAEYEIMINFHGANKPTGRDRTWQHEMNREKIRGWEMGKMPALHDAALPFTRVVHGPEDYTPTYFRPDKLKGSTWTHELAMAVIFFTSPFMCLAGDPVS
ncbi:MAG: glycoside hydrolase family 97 catalytic domain-containing protein [Rikenellaceae bacterium]|nr:glycoside hydrolase family 97 catalytic domain-containing protein [Rikenellaceae bacterium]